MPKPASSDNHRLHVYKASAGSGKTHRLTGEYLTLLFAAPANYRHILAVTFTNKATDEMKSRIVQQLHRLAHGESSDYLVSLQAAYNLDEKVVRAQARDILHALLHDYSAFSVSTIDRFFQQTMRAFSREMGLSGSYNVEVDEKAMLAKVIDLMLFELDNPENEMLKTWIAAFMNENIERGKSWRIHREIETLGKEIFNEKFKKLSPAQREKIQDKAQLEAYKKQLFSIVNEYVSTLKVIGEKALAIMARNGLEPFDFVGSGRSQFFKFAAFANGEVVDLSNTFINFPDNLEAWSAKKTLSSTKIAIEQAYYDGLNACVKEVIAHYENNFAYCSAQAVLQNFNVLGILNDLRNRLQQFQHEENILFISDTTELLNKIVADSESPFIYEKIGTRMKHFMIDEFQDTSAMQWENFRPLLNESLASDNQNLIVGDVKQSIYRFRNSDWKLLEEQVPRDFSSHIRSHTLDTNWRSDAHVVWFNNAFFDAAARKLQLVFNEAMNDFPESEFKTYLSEKIVETYSEAYQRVPENKSQKNGYVEVNFVADSKENDWKTDVLEQLPHTIEQLQNQGFALSDIAIVVRKNSEAIKVAQSLLSFKAAHPDLPYRYDIISDEALLIGSAQGVKAAIALFRAFENGEDRTKKAIAVYETLRFLQPEKSEEIMQSIFSKTTIDFPESLKRSIDALEFLPIYEMAEHFFALADDNNQQENAHLQAFLDLILDFTAKESSSINDFLRWWDEKGNTKTIYSPSGQDAIRLITIHKSKGLGFGVVLMPFVNWEIDNVSTGYKTNYIWCEPKVAPFDAIGIVPLRYTAQLADTIFRAEYFNEKLYNYIDNLNLLYVAFTRAKHQLIAFAPRKSDGKDAGKVKHVGQLLFEAISHAQGDENNESAHIQLANHLEEKEADNYRFTLGNPTHSSEKKSEVMDTLQIHALHSIPFHHRLKMRLNSLGFFSDDGSRDYGTMMHEIVSRVRTHADVENALEAHFLQGSLAASEKEKMLQSLRAYIALPEVEDWYSEKYDVLNEMQILHPRFGFSRPDRVMIGKNNEAIVVDYKFGNIEDGKHIRQVQRYKVKLEEMGYAPVQGFVFYVTRKKVIEV